MGRETAGHVLTSTGRGASTKPRLSPLSLGLGSLFSTLLIYAGTVTPFLRYDSILNFVGTFAFGSLIALLACSITFALALLAGASLPDRLLASMGGILYLPSSAAFGYLAFTGSSDPLVLYLGAIACGIGDCCLCLIWGRRFRRFDLRGALLNVAAACLMGTAAYGAYLALDPLAGTGLFLTLATVTVVTPATAFSERQNELEEQSETPPATRKPPSGFVRVIAKPALGLLAFSFVMGSMNYAFVEHFNTYLSASCIAACALGAASFLRARRPLAHILYRDLIPFCAIAALAAPTVLAALHLHALAMFPSLLLYTFAAFLTIATLCAIANASEFSSDLVFSTALALFAAASLIGLTCSRLLPPDTITVVTTLVTTAYAATTVAMRTTETDASFAQELIRDPSSSDNLLDEANDSANVRGHGRPDVASTCARIAEEHSLTAREQEILLYLAEGHSGAYIADVLFISPNTARTHIHNIYRKLGVSSREDVLQLAKGDRISPKTSPHTEGP